MRFLSFDSSTTGVTCGAGSANPSGAPAFLVGFVMRDLRFCVVLCRSLFVDKNGLSLLAIVLSALLRFTVSGYPFHIFKLY